MMRQFLYISPYFPPQRRVGALRPLKFVRHLAPLGWKAVVLCDLRPGDPVDAELLDAVPESTEVVRDYGWCAQRASRAYGAARQRSLAPRVAPRFPLLDPVRRWANRAAVHIDQNPELLPLGEHSLDLPHALAAARRTLARHPCEAVVVNADPYAALLVGRAMARETGIPFLADLRDPWALCELRRPLRPWPQLRLVDRLERQVVEAAARVILNTESTRARYVEHYHDLPERRFVVIRNHADASLIDAPARPLHPHFTLVFLGNIRRFVEGKTLLVMLAELRKRGHGPEAAKLHVVGSMPESARAAAAEWGVLDQIVVEPPVPYREIGGVMKSADLLVAVSHAGQQRIPAKVYDYLTVRRPLLAITDNLELQELLRRAGGAHTRKLDDGFGCADLVERLMSLGRGGEVERADVGTSSAQAAARLTDLLESSIREG